MGRRSRERRKRTLAAARAARRAGPGPDPSEEGSARSEEAPGAPQKKRPESPEGGGADPEEAEGPAPRATQSAEDRHEASRDAVLEEGMAWLRDDNAVNEHVQKIDLVEMLEEAGGLVRIENFLPAAAAEAALHIIETLPEARWEVRRDADDADRNATAHRFFVASARGRKDPLALVRRAVQSLLPEKKAVISAGKYSAGDHIATHDDLGYHREDGKLWSRDVAVIFYLTKGWKKEDGGVLLDLDKDAKQSSYVPLFNSLVSFIVPREHAVTAVRPRQGRSPRYSLFGWFLVEGDLYSFAPDPSSAGPTPKSAHRLEKSTTRVNAKRPNTGGARGSKAAKRRRHRS